MRRTISSDQTFIMKFVFPAIWIGIFAAMTLVLFAGGGVFRDRSGTPPPPELKWFFLIATIGGAAALYWFGIRLKRVALDASTLYVSNYRREIGVPLRDIEEVSENRWVSIHPVTVRFFRETEFGAAIVFMPKARWFALFSSHPVVKELRAAVARARGSGSDGSAA